MKIIPIKQEKPAATPAAAPAKPVEAITVNGCVISAEDIAAEAQNHPMPQDKPEWAWGAAAHALVIRELLLQAAQAKSIQAEPIELDAGQWETNSEALIRALLEQELTAVTYDEDALKAIYEANVKRFCAPSLFEAAHILIPFGNQPELRQAAYNQAQSILAELQATPRRFAALAQQYSACPSKASGGSLGQMTSGDTVPEFEAALATMAEGTISSAPLETRYGFHIIRLDARERGQVLPFERVLPQLKEAHAKAHWVQAGRDYMQRLVQAAHITGIDLNHRPWAQ